MIDLLGVQPQAIEADGNVLLSRIHPEDRDDFEHSSTRVIQTQDRWMWDGRFLHEDGQYSWLRSVAQITERIV